MQSPDAIDKHQNYLCYFHISTLAIKLCRESLFGEDIMKQCTVQGSGKHHALPEEKLDCFMYIPHNVEDSSYNLKFYGKNARNPLDSAVKACEKVTRAKLTTSLTYVLGHPRQYFNEENFSR